ncbi:MAG: DUF4351 domain-containing protein [Magnetococcales bacterium]|nr:DUF4351 domain-containing protein [Magnetococcales bacterium]
MTDVLDQWIHFIKCAGTLETIPDTIREEPIRHAFEKARVANMTAEEFELYEKAGMAIADAQGAVQLAREEGWQKGRQDGWQDGRQAEAVAVLRRLLSRRFGRLPERVSDTVAQADLPTLETWTDRVLDARSLNDVFGG